VTFSSTGAPGNIGNFTTGSSARTFPNAGTFSYQCTNHAGMSGTVTVQ
jgi:plastocyanin